MYYTNTQTHTRTHFIICSLWSLIKMSIWFFPQTLGKWLMGTISWVWKVGLFLILKNLYYTTPWINISIIHKVQLTEVHSGVPFSRAQRPEVIWNYFSHSKNKYFTVSCIVSNRRYLLLYIYSILFFVDISGLTLPNLFSLK